MIIIKNLFKQKTLYIGLILIVLGIGSAVYNGAANPSIKCVDKCFSAIKKGKAKLLKGVFAPSELADFGIEEEDLLDRFLGDVAEESKNMVLLYGEQTAYDSEGRSSVVTIVVDKDDDKYDVDCDEIDLVKDDGKVYMSLGY